MRHRTTRTVTTAITIMALLILAVPASAGKPEPGTNPSNPICYSGTYDDGTPYESCYWYDENGNVVHGGGSYSDPWYTSVYRWMQNLVNGVYNNHGRSN